MVAAFVINHCTRVAYLCFLLFAFGLCPYDSFFFCSVRAQALQQCGTEFSVMETFFPHRARKELKMKFFR
jgi:hypothetical protein